MSSSVARPAKASGRDILVALAIFSVLLGPCLLIYAWTQQRIISQFVSEGQTAQATIVGKDVSGTRKAPVHHVKVSFFDKPITQGGKLTITETSELINGNFWEELSIGQKIDVLFIPSKPDEVLLKACTDSSNLALIDKYPLGLIVTLLGAVGIVIAKLNKKSK